VSILSLRFVSKRRRVPVRAPGDGDGDVIVNGARDDVDDERDVCGRRARVENVRESLEGRVERVRVR